MRQGRWTLRRRLVISILFLLAAVSVVIGAVSTVALRGYLVNRLDAQITSASERFQRVVDRPNGDQPPVNTGGRPPGDFLPSAGLPPGTLGAFVRQGVLDGDVLGESLEVSPLTPAQEAALLALEPNVEPVTVSLGGDLGDYRVAVRSRTNGDTVITGMPLSDVNSTVLQLALVIGVVALAGLAAAFFAGTAIVRLALRPLDRVAATASHVAELPLERGEVALAVRVPDEDAQPGTEVGQVGAAINRMLGHIAAALTAREASEKKVRTFVADASHELRTPLASIRGYAELTRRGGHELPKDVVHAMDRIESESVRMTSLVEDLLLLARLDDGRSLESAPVDISHLLTNAVSDAHAAGQDHEWSLELPEQPVMVEGDSARLHQVVANILANARTHTPAGTRVSVSTKAADDGIDIVIADDGPGIDEAVRASVFERFVRGDSSRSRAVGSTGLGLAIVQAVVTAHGGSVAVESEPGATVFTIHLPRSGSDQSSQS